MKQEPLTQFVLTLVLYSAVIFLYPLNYARGRTVLRDSGYETVAAAEALAHGKGFSNPYTPLETGPTAHVAPVYPAMQAAMIAIMPSAAAAWFAIQCCATAIVLLQLRLLPWLTERVGLGFYPGMVAAGLWLVGRVPRVTAWEQNLSGLLMTLTVYFMWRGLKGKLMGRELLLAGLVWGLLILNCPVAVLGFAAWLLLLHPERVPANAQKIALLLIPLLVIAPWLLRNFERFHGFVFVRDNLGLELEVSNNPCTRFSLELNRVSGCFADRHPNESLSQATAVRELGELAYNRQRMEIAKAWIRENPSAFLKLTAKRALAFWFPSALRAEQSILSKIGQDRGYYSPWRDLVVSIASLAALPGLVLFWRRNRPIAIVLLIWLLSYPPVYYITQYTERGRIPVMWAILLPAGYAITELWCWSVSRLRKVEPRAHCAGGAR